MILRDFGWVLLFLLLSWLIYGVRSTQGEEKGKRGERARQAEPGNQGAFSCLI